MPDYIRTLKGEAKPLAQMAGVEYNRGMVKKPKKQTVYCPPELVPHVFCGTVLNLAIHKNPEARKLYEQLKVDLNLPGCQKRFAPIENLDIRFAKKPAKETGQAVPAWRN